MSDRKLTPRGCKPSPGQLAPATQECLQEIFQSFENYFRADAERLLIARPEMQRVCAGFNSDLVKLFYLRAHFEPADAGADPWEKFAAKMLGWDDLSPGRKWLMDSFARVSTVAFKECDKVFFEQVAKILEGMDFIAAHHQFAAETQRLAIDRGITLKQAEEQLRPEFEKRLKEKASVMAQDRIEEAYDYLSKILQDPPDNPSNLDTFREQVCHCVLRPPYQREPSSNEIRTYLEHFHEQVVTREQIKGVAKLRGWKLPDSRPFPGMEENEEEHLAPRG